MARGRDGAFQRLERGEIGLSDFYGQFSAELADPASVDLYRRYLESRGRPIGMAHLPPMPAAYNGVDDALLSRKIEVDAKRLFKQMMQAAATPNELMIEAIRRLKGSSIRIRARHD